MKISKVISGSFISWKMNIGTDLRKPTFRICENKGADQLRSNCEADQPLCFRYTDSTIPLRYTSKISSLLASSVLVQLCLCRTVRKPHFCWFISWKMNIGIVERKLHHTKRSNLESVDISLCVYE